MLKVALRGATCAAAFAFFGSSPAFAQESAAQVAADNNDSVIVVTGTRLKTNPEVAGPNPVVTIDAETIAKSGRTNLTELLTEIPALFNSKENFDAAGSQARFGAAGVNLLDLRNLGPQRTLVLVDSRRHIAGVSGEAGVDINTIPIALVDRVDVLTGGVSSVYGADGVSGVVNFVMKRNFEGFDFRAQKGISKFGDAPSTFLAGTVGSNFSDGRGNIAASYEFRKDGRVAFGDRPNGRFDSLQLVRNPSDQPDDPNIPDFIPLPYIGWADSSPYGALSIDTSFTAVFRGDGAPYRSATFLPNSGFRSAGGPDTDDTPVASYQGDLQAATEHHSFNLLGSYELTPAIRLFAEGKYVKTKTFTSSQPSFDFFTFVSNENPFIPQNVRDAVDAVGQFGGVFVSRDNFDLGVRGERLDRDVMRGVIGFDGELGDSVKFELSYVYGRNKTKYFTPNNRLEDRYFAALDAVDEGQFLTGTPNGRIVCRVSIDGSGIVDSGNFNYGQAPQTFSPNECVPLNIFGQGVASQAALNFINVDLQNQYTLSQHVVNGYLSGDFGGMFKLPGGPVSFVIGGEYRKENSVSRFDPIAKQVSTFNPDVGVLADQALLSDETGSFDVLEGFAELALPVLADMPFAELLELRAAVRLSDYSTSGYVDSWSFSGIWAPVEDLRFRGSYSKATRAPNITELFAPRTGTFQGVDDPCDPVNVSNGAPVRAANCRTLIEGLGADYDTYDYGSSINSSATIEGFLSGNRKLEPEEATTWTAGVVMQPRVIPGLSLSLDWYDIDLKQAINTTSLTELAEFCVDSPTLDNQFCDRVSREAGTGFVNSYTLQPVNVAFFETAGADLTLSYKFAVGASSKIAFRGTLGYLDKLKFLPSNGGTVNDNRGETGAPKWNGNADVTFAHKNVSINYGVQYIGSQLRYEKDELAANPDRAAPQYLKIGSRFMHDLRADFETDDKRFDFFFGVNNFTNELPSISTSNTPTGWLGRYFYAGVRISSETLGF
jgi:iron complex outermembrane recepter protein